MLGRCHGFRRGIRRENLRREYDHTQLQEAGASGNVIRSLLDVKSAARLNDEPRGLVDRDNTGALVKIAVASARRCRLDFCSGSFALFSRGPLRDRFTPVNDIDCVVGTSQRCHTRTFGPFDLKESIR